MNASRKKKLEKLISELEDIQGEMAEIREAEQDQFDNASEKWQESDKGDKCQEIITCIEEFESACEDLINNLSLED